jgi:hypothetical protein
MTRTGERPGGRAPGEAPRRQPRNFVNQSRHAAVRPQLRVWATRSPARAAGAGGDAGDEWVLQAIQGSFQ